MPFAVEIRDLWKPAQAQERLSSRHAAWIELPLPFGRISLEGLKVFSRDSPSNKHYLKKEVSGRRLIAVPPSSCFWPKSLQQDRH